MNYEVIFQRTHLSTTRLEYRYCQVYYASNYLYHSFSVMILLLKVISTCLQEKIKNIYLAFRTQDVQNWRKGKEGNSENNDDEKPSEDRGHLERLLLGERALLGCLMNLTVLKYNFQFYGRAWRILIEVNKVLCPKCYVLTPRKLKLCIVEHK